MIQKFKMYLTVGVSSWNEGNFSLTVYNPDTLKIANRTDAMVKQVEVEVEVPDKVDIVALKLKALEEALEQDKVDTTVRHNLLLDQISKLKCLTHDDVLEAV